VYENLAFGLRMRKMPKNEQRRRVEEITRVLGPADMLQRRPAQLSGGQRQRVAMGRAMMPDGLGRPATILGRFDRSFLLHPGEAAEVSIDARRLHFFDVDSGAAIPAQAVPTVARLTG
jgi:hypothetical protein